MDNEDGAVSVIRESRRNILVLNRKDIREKQQDNKRLLNDKKLNPNDILLIANKLKTSASVSVGELAALKNLLADSSDNVESFLSIHGSMRGLVRELTGVNDRASVAAGCVCNVSATAGRTAMAASPYLITSLDCLHSELAITCAWSLGNLAATGSKVCKTLLAQGALTKLICVLEGSTNEEMHDAVLYALMHFIYTLEDDLSMECLQKLINCFVNMKLGITLTHCLFLLSCHAMFLTAELEQCLKHVQQHFHLVFVKHVAECLDTNTEVCCEALFLIRTLANCCASNKYCDVVLNFLASKHIFLELRQTLHTDCVLRDNLLWLLGNVFNYSLDIDLRNMFFNNLLTE